MGLWGYVKRYKGLQKHVAYKRKVSILCLIFRRETGNDLVYSLVAERLYRPLPAGKNTCGAG